MGYQFDDVSADIPSSIPEIEDEMGILVGDMAEIDVQFVFYKNNPDARDSAWHGRALAAKGHMMRRLRALKLAKREMMEASRQAAARAREASKAEHTRIVELSAEAKQTKWRKRFHALQSWMWENYPEHRDALIAELARLKND